MKTTKVKAIGRPSTVTKIIKKNALLFISKTPKELVEILFNEVQPKMRGGVTDDPQRIKAQKTSLYQSLIRYKKQAAEEGKKINFRGRMVNGQLKTAWIHSRKEAVPA